MLIRYTLLIGWLLCAFPAIAQQPAVTLVAVGDVMLARTVPQRLATHGEAWAWEKIAPYMAQADIRMCNLECAVTNKGLAVPKRYSFRADTALAARVLTAGKFSVATLANNHSYDYGAQGLADTLITLHTLGIAGPGAGMGRAAAIQPHIVTSHGLRIAFVAYTWWPPEGYIPTPDGPNLAMLDETTLAAELREAKKNADFLVVSFHWGKEYLPVPSDGQRRVAHLAIDAGADVIIGHHPHVVQPVEIYHNRPIFYSLGNCVFDRSGSQWSNGLLACVRLSPGHVRVERKMPLAIQDARPVPMQVSKKRTVTMSHKP